jgi:hypothetical protein
MLPAEDLTVQSHPGGCVETAGTVAAMNAQEKPAHEIALRFFDLEARIQSDSATFIDLFARMYRRFRVDDARTLQRPKEFAVWTRSDNPWGHPVMILDGEVRRLSDLTLLEGYLYDGILSGIVSRVRSHFLIHAGVVASHGRGVVLVADSSHGKTTLVLELVRRGFSFLSDEMAALGREDRHVHPFPRSLRVRPGTLEMTGFPEAAEGAAEWLGKLFLDIDEIQPGSMSQPVPIGHVVILRDPAGVESADSESPERELGVLVDRLDQSLLTAVRDVEGVSDVRSTVERGYPALRLRAVHRMAALAEIETICDQQGVLLLDINKRAESQPDFQTPARLEPLSGSVAVMELLRRFQGGHKSALLQEEFDGNAARLFMELAALVGQASCHQLYVGPLVDMADLVCGLVAPPT